MKKTRVGIFEDDLVNRFIYERMFRLKNAELDWHIFDSPEKGLAYAAENPFDMVMIELHFWEDFGGIDILNRLKQISTPGLISIAMTSLLQEGDVERVLSSGFTMCVEKPVALAELDIFKTAKAN